MDSLGNDGWVVLRLLYWLYSRMCEIIMNVTLNTKKHGHNVHDKRGGVGDNDADLACRRAVLVHRRDHPDFARAGRGWLRGLGHPAHSSDVPLRSQIVQLASLCTAVLLGLSFAFPTFGASPTLIMSSTSTIDAIPLVSVASRYNETTSAPCTYAKMVWSWTATEDSFITKLTINAKTSPASGNDPFSVDAYLFAWTQTMHDVNAVPIIVYADNYTQWTGTPTTTSFTFSSPILTALAGQKLYFEVGPSLEIPQYEGGGGPFSSNAIVVDRASSTHSNASTTDSIFLGHPNECTTPNTDPFFKPAFALYGYVLAGAEPPGSSVPTSTYDGTYSEFLPTIGFTTSSPNLPGGIFTGKINNMFGAAAVTFPLCVVTPWIAFMDVLQGFTSVPQTANSMQINGLMGAPTTTLSLGSASTTFAQIGLKPILDLLIPFLEAMAWLSLGYFIFADLFTKPNDDGDSL